MNLYNKFIWAL